MTAHDLARDALAKALKLALDHMDATAGGVFWNRYEVADVLLAALIDSPKWQAALAAALGPHPQDPTLRAARAAALAAALGGRDG